MAGVFANSGLLGLRALSTPDGFDFLHPSLDGGFRKIRALLELLENARTLVLLLEALDGAIDGFVIRDHDADQTKSPPSNLERSTDRTLAVIVLLLCDDAFQKPSFSQLLKGDDDSSVTPRCPLL